MRAPGMAGIGAPQSSAATSLDSASLVSTGLLSINVVGGYGGHWRL